MTGSLRHGKRHGTGETIGIAGNEGVEGGVLVQVGLRVKQRPVLAAMKFFRLFRRHGCGNGELPLGGFLGRRGGREDRIFLDRMFYRLGGFHDFERGEDVLFRGFMKGIHQRLVQFVL